MTDTEREKLYKGLFTENEEILERKEEVFQGELSKELYKDILSGNPYIEQVNSFEQVKKDRLNRTVRKWIRSIEKRKEELFQDYTKNETLTEIQRKELCQMLIALNYFLHSEYSKHIHLSGADSPYLVYGNMRYFYLARRVKEKRLQNADSDSSAGESGW